jgi:hypothetical protein
MKKAVVFLILLVGIAFGASTVSVSVVINASKVAETNSHFPFTFDLSRLPADWWFFVHNKGNIFVKDSLGQNVKRVVDSVNFANDSGVITWDASVSTSISKKYTICVNADSALTNSSDVFTVSNCLIRQSLDGSASPLVDACGNYNLTNHSATLAVPGKMGRAVSLTSVTKYLNSAVLTQSTGATTWTSSFLIRMDEANTARLALIGNGIFACFETWNGNFRCIYPYSAAYQYGIMNGQDALFTVGQWAAVSYVFNGAGATNSDKVKVYVNGTPVTINTFSGDPVAAAINGASNTMMIGDGSGARLTSFDEIRNYTDAKSAGWIQTEYNMIFDATTASAGVIQGGGHKKKRWGLGWWDAWNW